MLIGILRADAVAAPLLARHGDYPDMFRTLLGDPGARPPDLAAPEFVDFDARAFRDPGTPADARTSADVSALPAADACDAWVITGSRHSVYDDLPWIAALAEFTDRALRAARPVVGICFGHQLIAHFFGGATRAAEGGWCVGVQHARVVAGEPWMVPAAESLALCASHRDQVLRLPPDARLFAAGATCPYAGFVLGAGGGRRAEALTFQGHPEFSRAYTGELMDSRERELGQALHRAGRASLAEPVDDRLAAGWILRFLAGAA